MIFRAGRGVSAAALAAAPLTAGAGQGAELLIARHTCARGVVVPVACGNAGAQDFAANSVEAKQVALRQTPARCIALDGLDSYRWFSTDDAAMPLRSR